MNPFRKGDKVMVGGEIQASHWRLNSCYVYVVANDNTQGSLFLESPRVGNDNIGPFPSAIFIKYNNPNDILKGML